MRRLLTILLLLSSANAQVYLPANADITVHPGDTVSIFGNVTNMGRFGSLNGGVVQFYGGAWQNGAGSQLPDEAFYGMDTANGQGGYFRFLTANNQTIGGGSFPNLGAADPLGISLTANAQVRHKLNLENGLLYCNGYNLTLGNGSPGVIGGYNANNYIVTDTTGTLSRQAVRESNGLVVFPIGTGTYTPLALQSHTAAPVIFTTKVNDGPTADTAVNKTWNITTNTLNVGDVTVWLQHNLQDEGTLFTGYRDSSYISLDGDTLGPRGALNPGTLTTGTPDAATWLNARDFTGSVLANASLRIVTNTTAIATLDFEAFRSTIRLVQTFWTTQVEHDVQRYELQRRRLEEDSFYTVAVVPPHTPDGNSDTPQRYQQNDDDYYGKVTYYRLKIFGKDGQFTYSQIRAVPPAVAIQVSPNPTFGTFIVSVFGQNNPVAMVMYDMAGHRINVYTINGSATIDAGRYAAGTYVLVFYNGSNWLGTQRIILLRH